MISLDKKYGDDVDTFLCDFIKYLSSTMEDAWCVDVVRSSDKTANCLFGHLAEFCEHQDKDYHEENFEWFSDRIGTSYYIYPINDGKNHKYQQATPKQRCISYLRAIQSGKELTTHEQMHEDFQKYLQEFGD